MRNRHLYWVRHYAVCVSVVLQQQRWAVIDDVVMETAGLLLQQNNARHCRQQRHGITGHSHRHAVLFTIKRWPRHARLAIGCIVVSGVIVVVGACNHSQRRTSKCTCLIFGVSIDLEPG